MAKYSTKNNLFFTFLALSVVAIGAMAYFLSANQLALYKSGASNTIQSASGTLLKKGTAAFSNCKSLTSAYALLGSVNTGTHPVGGQTPPSPCTALVVAASIADPFVGKSVIATGTLQNGVFYATAIKLSSNLVPMPPLGGNKKVPTPVPATPCPGLGNKAVCDPKATSASQKCCSPYSCQGIFNNKTGATSNYTCSSGVRAL